MAKQAAALSREEVLQRLQQALPQLRAQYGVMRLAIYGSVARGEHTPESDVDVLVELSRPLGYGFVALADHLEQALGCSVDVSTFASIRRASQMPGRRGMVESVLRDLIDVPTAA